MHIWDLRKESAAATICGPKICGDCIDVKGQHILTGAHRSTDQLQLWDFGSQQLVHTFKWEESKQVAVSKTQESSALIFCCQFSKTSGDNVVAVGGNSMKMFDLREDFRELMEVRVGDHTTLYSMDNGNFSSKLVFGGKGGLTYYLNVNTHAE